MDKLEELIDNKGAILQLINETLISEKRDKIKLLQDKLYYIGYEDMASYTNFNFNNENLEQNLISFFVGINLNFENEYLENKLAFITYYSIYLRHYKEGI